MRKDARRHLIVNHQPHKSSQKRSSCRARQSLEKALVDDADVAVEASKPHACTQAVDEGRSPAKSTEMPEAELIHHQRRSHAERRHVGNRVKLFAELALGMRQTRNAPVHAVKNH